MRAAFFAAVSLGFSLACQGNQPGQGSVRNVTTPTGTAQAEGKGTDRPPAETTPPQAPAELSETPTVPPSVQPPQAEKEQVVAGGNLLRDPVGVVISSVFIENDRDEFNGPLYVEGERMFDADSPDAPVPQPFSRDGDPVAGAVPLFRAGGWYFARGDRLLHRQLATSTKPKRDTLIATFPGNIVEMIWRDDELFVLHDRELEHEDATGGENVGIIEMQREHDPDGADIDLLVAPAHDISRVSAVPQTPPAKPERVVKERRQIRSWAVGGSKDPILVYYLEFEEGQQGSGLPAELPPSIRMLDPNAKAPREVVGFPLSGPSSLIDGVAVNDRFVFWFDSDGKQGSLWRKAHQGTEVAARLASGKDLCWACVPRLQGGYVYWDSDNYALRMPQAGGAIEGLKLHDDDLAKSVKSDRSAWALWKPGRGK